MGSGDTVDVSGKIICLFVLIAEVRTQPSVAS